MLGCEIDGGLWVMIVWIYVWLEGCVTGLPECGLGYGYNLACGSDLVDGHGRWIYFVSTLVGWFIL